MARKIREVSGYDVSNIELAIQMIGQAATLLYGAGATRAGSYARKAQKSAMGAGNHARRCFNAKRPTIHDNVD